MLKCLFRDGIVNSCTSFFDFGCGYGEDVHFAKKQDIDAHGWDPAFCPDEAKIPSDIVNLGYALNVIEDLKEREETLRESWELARRVLVVSARILVGGQGADVEFGDGILTQIGTFQKFYAQAELREYIETITLTHAHPTAPGVFYVFRDEGLRQQFLATRFRRVGRAPRRRVSEVRFEEHRATLEPLMEWVAERGRLPEPDGFPLEDELRSSFGSLRRAFALIRRVTGPEDWELAKQRRTEDLLVYLALARFSKRPRFSAYPIDLQRDIRAFFGSFRRACDTADALLFRVGDAHEIDEACHSARVGRLVDNGLIVHRTAIGELDPLLRVFEGCARSWIGDIDEANLVKLHRFSGKISYLACPDFDRNPHPSLVRRVNICLRSRDVYCVDYSKHEDPPIVNCKDTYLGQEHPLRSKFTRLTSQEQRWGLLDDQEAIGTRHQLDAKLKELGVTLQGHRLIRRA